MAKEYVSELRMNERIKLDGATRVTVEGQRKEFPVEGYDLSPTAVALLVPNDHKLFDFVKRMFRDKKTVTLTHPMIDSKRAHLHRIIRYNSDKTRWVFSFTRRISYSNGGE